MRKIVWILAIVALIVTATIAYLNNTIYSHNEQHNSAAAKPRPNIVILAMMKSGSENIAYGLNYNRIDLYSTYEANIDWCIDNLLKLQVEWINDWLALKAKEDQR